MNIGEQRLQMRRQLRAVATGRRLPRRLYSSAVGRHGEIVGVDMTDHLGWHQKRFGDGKSTVHFLKGYIERLDELDLAAERCDVIVSKLRDQSLGGQAR